MSQVNTAKEFGELLKALTAMGPGSNYFTMALFVLPQDINKWSNNFNQVLKDNNAKALLQRLTYTANWQVHPNFQYFGSALKDLYVKLFAELADPLFRAQLLGVAGLSENQFKVIDPLRYWLDTLIKSLSGSKPYVLSVLGKILDLLANNSQMVLTFNTQDPIVNTFGVTSEQLLDSIETLSSYYVIRASFVPLDQRALTATSVGSSVYNLQVNYSVRIEKEYCPLLLPAYADLRGRL
ncbi:MAG: hypothetical protein QW429_06730 [Thermoprotei archaeon]